MKRLHPGEYEHHGWIIMRSSTKPVRGPREVVWWIYPKWGRFMAGSATLPGATRRDHLSGAKAFASKSTPPPMPTDLQQTPDS